MLLFLIGNFLNFVNLIVFMLSLRGWENMESLILVIFVIFDVIFIYDGFFLDKSFNCICLKLFCFIL